MRADHHFEGKVAIVTGAASGIGRALAGALARRGATVVLADLDEAGAKEAADSLRAGPPGRVSGVALDVTDAAAFAELVDRVTTDHIHLDLLFNNAGIGMGGDMTELTLAHWDRVIDVNLRGVVHGVTAAYPVMVGQGSGHIVNTASLAGLIPSPYLVPYAATKHAVVGLSVSLRAEAAARGVRVSALCPGIIRTPIWDKLNGEDLAVPSLDRQKESFDKLLRRSYPPERLAADTLAGVVRNKPVICAPAHARLAWGLWRAAPRLMVDQAGKAFRRTVGQT